MDEVNQCDRVCGFSYDVRVFLPLPALSPDEWPPLVRVRWAVENEMLWCFGVVAAGRTLSAFCSFEPEQISIEREVSCAWRISS